MSKKKDEKKQVEEKQEPANQPAAKTRRIVIETDGNKASLVEAEVAGYMELKAIFEAVLGSLAR